jgi:hypothetical protein
LQLLWLIGASNAIGTITVFTLAVYKWHSHSHPIPPSISFRGITLILLCAVGGILAESDLRNGVESESWSNAQLVLPRRVVSHPVVWIWAGSLFAFVILYGIVTPLGNSALGTLVLPALLSLGRISSILQEKQKNGETPSSLRLSAMRALRSDNWGR